MKRRTFLQYSSASTVALGVGKWQGALAAAAPAAAALEASFRNPPAASMARTWWHWMNGNVSQVGITRDLEAMKRVGVGGVHLFQVGLGMPQGPVAYGSDEHTRLLRFAATEANRLGLGFAMANCPGWSSSGGPWISARPEHGMQVLTCSETRVTGGAPVSVALRQPQARRVPDAASALGAQTYYREVQVLAFPASDADAAMPVALGTAAGSLDAAAFAAGASAAELKPEGGGTAYLQIEYAQPIEVRSVAVLARATAVGAGADVFTVEVSMDGAQFRKVGDLSRLQSRMFSEEKESLDTPAVANFAPLTARVFRIQSSRARRIAEVSFSGLTRDPEWAGGSGLQGSQSYGVEASAAAAASNAPSGPALSGAQVLDITASMDASGLLNWQAPAGNWIVLRIGQTLLGATNKPAVNGGEGLECDKFSRAATDYHFEQYFGKLFDVIDPLAQKGLAGALIDSYEISNQNWTRDFAEEFRKRRGYALTPYMPAMIGRVVGSGEETRRFYHDVRKTQAELMQEYYYGAFAEQCRKRRIEAYFEPYGGPFEEFRAGAHADMPMGEFWQGAYEDRTARLAASIAHIHGKTQVGAEAFTGISKWQEHPFALKCIGDFMFANGVNSLVMHRYAHQPHPDAAPGMSLGPFGMYFDRGNTWFEKSGDWLKGYVARSQSLLRQGYHSAELLYFTGEDPAQSAPAGSQLNPQPPAGYAWDLIDTAGIMDRLKVNADGSLQLTNGSRYALLVLPAMSTISLPLLLRLQEMVSNGMILVVNSKPGRTPGLTNREADDASVRRIVGEMWGRLDGAAVTQNQFGIGRLTWNLGLTPILNAYNFLPSVEISARSSDTPVHWMHRKAGDADLYFIAASRRQQEDLVVSFNVKGRQPELWDAASGEIKKLAVYEEVDGRTRVPVPLDPAGSMFVVFRAPTAGRNLRRVTKDNISVLNTQPFADRGAGLYRSTTQNFTITLWVKPETMGLPPAVGSSFRPSSIPAPASWVFAPSAGETLYGANHASCGLMATREGVAVCERTAGAEARTVATARAPLTGWTHVAIVYRNGQPYIYLNGKVAAQGASSGKTVHPGYGESRDYPAEFVGQCTRAQVVAETMDDKRLQQLVAAGLPEPDAPRTLEFAGGERPALLAFEDGIYEMTDFAGQSTSFTVAELGGPTAVEGAWTVRFPANSGAPAELRLNRLQSLHRHEQPGVKYFAGVATYARSLRVSAAQLAPGRRLFLDLGRVEVIADVRINGKAAGTLWKPPYRLDVTDLVQAGDNQLQIEVATLWPNRLIGDEQLPAENNYAPSLPITPNPFESGGVGGIAQLPGWYAQGQAKPAGGRIAFAAYKHYRREDPLMESGLLGPVKLRSAQRQDI